ncbi:MAG: NAD(P)-dependent oxidoreductase [Planctomycetaceae bacterium]|nr:MAG: NAD(P)-dependent oxidoreductase [Planctomycetaceae bacterium]
MRFAEKVVVITGGALGIGRGCARVFCEQGGRAALLDINRSAGTQLADELTQRGPGCAEFIDCDARDPRQLAHAIEVTVRRWGRIDCLINNVGVHPPATPFAETRLADVEDLFRINFLSTFAATQAALPHLTQTRGTIVVISSMTAVLGQNQSVAYASTKAAQVGFVKSLAVELGPLGIRVNAILPSNIDTPLMRAWAATLPDPESALQRVAALQVFGRMGTPEEIGRVALFLATEDSSFITGQALEAEGGASLDY